MSKVGCFTRVVDFFGAGGTSTARVYVHPKVLSIDQLFNISQEKTSLALDAANCDAAKQVLVAASASASTSSSSSSNVGTRRLDESIVSATPTTSTEKFFASLLQDLWLTYEITTTTADNVASLIAVLVGIIAQPANIASSTASSALRFLSQA